MKSAIFMSALAIGAASCASDSVAENAVRVLQQSSGSRLLMYFGVWVAILGICCFIRWQCNESQHKDNSYERVVLPNQPPPFQAFVAPMPIQQQAFAAPAPVPQ